MNVGSAKRVGIVDDDTSYCRAAARLLRAYGFEVLTFCSAEAFLDTDREVPVDGLLVDIHLGGMSGFDLQRRLAEAGLGTPVVFVSGHTEEALAIRAAGVGCAFVRKSDPGEVVVAAIRKAVADAGPSREAGAVPGGVPPHLSS